MAEVTQGGHAPILSGAEIDAIGEILNISMGSAATAVSTMLDRQVVITTPKVEVQKFHEVSYAALEPAILVKIEYIEGLTGSNVMVFRQSDMQIILNLLMGNDAEPTEDFAFDEMSMSAACEVMNQMMGASATALSNFLGKAINISTPTASAMDSENTFENQVGLGSEEEIVSVSFQISISGVMNSEFISIMTCGLAKDLVGQMMDFPEDESARPVQTQPAAPAAAAPPPSAPAAPAAPPQQKAPPAPPSAPAATPTAPPPSTQPAAPQQPAPGMPPMQGYPQPGVPGMPPEWQMPYPGGQMPPYGYYNPYGYPPMMPPQIPQEAPQAPSSVMKPQQVNVQTPKFPNFAGQQAAVFAAPLTGGNMDLMMNIPLNVSVEIGKTKRKIREIMDFTQGTVIELEKQAGAPVDIVVNGQLIARGDVVVVDDNFGVRVTEIVGTKELVDSLENN